MRVAVLAGGRSAEHDVSVSSAAAVAGVLAEAGHEVLGVDLLRDGTWAHEGEELALRPGRGLLDADVVFPVLHGPLGEDGAVQGMLELLDVAYVGSDVAASAVCMDKIRFKDAMAHAGLPQVAFRGLVSGDDPDAAADLGFPCWVKPARLGSSVGIARVTDADDLAGAVDAARAHDARVIVEASAPGIEVECSVLGPEDAPEASPPGEILLAGGEDGWYDFEAKYTPGGMELVVPARISSVAAGRVRGLAVQAFRIAGCSGLARVDFFVDGDRVLLNELNTMPGQTRTSVFGKLWEADGVPYADVLDRLLAIAVERCARERALRR